MTVSSKDGKELSTFSYTYDHAGNKLTSTETVDGKESKTEFSYDAENRLLEMKSGDKTITYTYDKNGNRVSTGAGDAKLDYIYDTENRLLAVKDKEGLLFAALYDGDDNRVFTASRTQATNTYQLFKRKPADKKRKSPYTSPDGEANSLFWYGFTQNVVQFFSGFTTSEGYDWIETFDTVSTAYHQKVAKDRATEEGLVVNPPSEDNLPGEDEVLYRSQVQDVLIPYTTKEDTYNYYETRNYVNDVNQQHTQVLQTYDDQLQKRETYVYGNGRATYTNESTGDSYHYLTSQSGSVTGLTQNGNSVASSSYNLYGATKQTTDTTGNPFAYNGEARDVTGLDYLRARYYDSQAGTFLTADSYSGSQTDPLSQNLYAYVQNNPANYTDPSGHIRSPHVMLDDRFGGKVYDSPRPLINTDDGTLYAPSTPEHKAHQIRQQQTGNYSYVYTPKVYSNTPIIKPTSYAQAQAQRDRAREKALAEQRRQQNIRNEYSRATGSKGKAKTREAQNLFKNWGAALSSMYTHVCKTAKRWVDSGVKFLKNVDWKKVGIATAATVAAIAVTVATAGAAAPVIASLAGGIGLTGFAATVATGVTVGAVGGAAAGGTYALTSGVLSGKEVGTILKDVGNGMLSGATSGALTGGLLGSLGGVASGLSNTVGRHVADTIVETTVDTIADLAQGGDVSLASIGASAAFNAMTEGVSSKAVTGAKADVAVNKPKASSTVESPDDIRQRVLANIEASKKARASSNFDEHLRREATIKAIHNVENGTTPLMTNAQKGNYGEMKMDRYMEERGYTRVSNDRVTSINAKGHQGIDGVYYHKGTDTYIVAEAKYNKAQLGNPKDGPQMSSNWIDKRLQKAVGSDLTDVIISQGYDSLLVRIMPDGSVKSKVLP
nr:RHS repeat-associated core domain-containing protein [Streptococcus suis]